MWFWISLPSFLFINVCLVYFFYPFTFNFPHVLLFLKYFSCRFSWIFFLRSTLQYVILLFGEFSTLAFTVMIYIWICILCPILHYFGLIFFHLFLKIHSLFFFPCTGLEVVLFISVFGDFLWILSYLMKSKVLIY